MISRRLGRHTAVLLGLAFALALLTGTALYRRATARLMREAEKDLSLLMTLRASALERYLETIRSEVVLWSDHGPVRDALLGLSAAWAELGPDAGAILRRLYIEENPFPAGEKHRYVRAPDNSSYTRIHADIQPGVERFLAAHGYYDIFLCDADGNVIYTYYKEDDFGTNLLDGPWRDTDLAAVFNRARSSPGDDAFAFSDLRRYEPSDDAPASFFANAVRDGDGVVQGVLVIQISSQPISEIEGFTAGMGETGETYVVGEDLLMRSDSRFSETSTALRQKVETEPVRRALAGESGVSIASNYRGIEVLSAYGPLDFEGVRWAVIAEIDLEEVLRPARRLRRGLLLAGLVALALVALGAQLSPPPLTRNP